MPLTKKKSTDAEPNKGRLNFFKRKGKFKLDVARKPFKGESSNKEEDEWENYDRSKVNAELKNNPSMFAWLMDEISLTATQSRIIAEEGYSDEGVEFLNEKLIEWGGKLWDEFEQNLWDVAYYNSLHGMWIYKRENLKGNFMNQLNEGRPLTTKRSFIEVANVMKIEQDKYDELSVIHLKDGPVIKIGERHNYYMGKSKTPSNYTWGTSRVRPMYQMFKETNRMQRTSVTGIQFESFPILKAETDELKLIEYLSQVGQTDEQINAALVQLRSSQEQVLIDIRKTATRGVPTYPWSDVKYLNTEVKRDLHSEKQEILRENNENLGRGELLSGNQTNKASQAIISKQVQQVTVIPNRRDIIRQFAKPELNNWLVQFGRPDFIGSVTLEFASSQTNDALNEAKIDEIHVGILGDKYAVKVGQKIGARLSEDDIVGSRERIAQKRKVEKPQDEEGGDPPEDDD